MNGCLLFYFFWSLDSRLENCYAGFRHKYNVRITRRENGKSNVSLFVRLSAIFGYGTGVELSAANCIFMSLSLN